MPPADSLLQNTYSQSSSKIKGIDFENLWIKNGHPLMVTAKGAAQTGGQSQYAMKIEKEKTIFTDKYRKK